MSNAVAGEDSRHQKYIEVAIGVLFRSDGAMLFTSRPEGKPCSGFWEFPGGKIEASETIDQALRRELLEELGIHIDTATLWRVTEHSYPHALVRLNWCKVFCWTGELEMREGQQMSWQQLPVSVTPILPGNYPALDWIAQERDYKGPTFLIA